ncbi:hypothetical protein PHLCEN_2v6016 [Hermanssonia centrifuga]|uniref:RING-type E3 ubiquitin transferase n=1 Tax=Hermanssonia centrifuga TaxID=98765 RepID=A0A2R6P0P4_9APHY|nr:hypothetical protein PHLCEN_2v6016 [Hermanssonia centrifuga]
MGDSTAWWLSNRPRPTSSLLHNDAHAHQNVTGSNGTANTFFSHPMVRAVSADIVAGQIIATVIVVAFVAVFLLREWISQNARPGVFDDAEAPPEERDEAVPAPAGDHVQDLHEEAIAPRQDAQRWRRRAREARGLPVPAVDHVQDIRAFREEAIALRREAQRLHQRAREAREMPVPVPPAEVLLPQNGHVPEGMDIWSRTANSESSGGEDEGGDSERKAKRILREKGKYAVASGTDAGSSGVTRRRHSWGEPHSRPGIESEPLVMDADQRQSTFTIPLPKPGGESSATGSGNGDMLESPKESLSESILGGTSDAVDTTSDNLEGSIETTPNAEYAPHRSFNRPPLAFTLSFQPAEGPSSLHLSSQSRSRGDTPLESPSLAIYRAPEELEAGSSNLSGYFRQDSPDDASAADLIEDEDYVYFRDVEPFPTHESPTEVAPNAEDTEVEMPGLQQWTDDEFEEPEDGDNIAVVFDGPADGPVEPNDADDQLPLGNDRGRDRPEQQQDMNVVVDLNDNDDMEGGMDEDMEGALEAIGLRGPIHAVLQNAALMIFVLDTTIGVGVWLPFTVGKSIALLSLDPRRFLYILHFPIRAIRIVTDPVVDSFMFLIARLVVPPLSRLGLLGIAFFTRLLSIVIGSGNATKSILFSATLYNRTIEAASGAWNYVFIILISPTATPPEPASSFINSLLAHDSAFMRVVDPLFAPIGEAVRLLWKDLLVTWERLALGDGTTEKLFAISLGYMVDILLVALYLNVLTVGSMKSAGRAVRSAVRQQLVVVKVAAFIVVELVVFPLGCGVMLDVCTVSLFPQGSFRSRTAFLMYAPLTTAFYHWVIGTMFMYQFAVLLAGFRSCLRPGALWFIKDPQDQNFHPIRDILERPTLVHIRKLIFSAFMYGLVVACGVATVSGMLRIFSRTIMPFRWKIREPLSTVPIDLLFLHLILPYTLRYFRPKKIVKQAGVHVWKFLAMQLRLSSYLFGGRHSTEEYSLKKWTLRTLISTNLDDTEVLHDGTFRRVPNSDNVALLKDELATVEVDAEGVPVNDTEDRLMQRQNQEAEKAKRSIKDDYTITYMPPRFKYRVITFMVAIWMVCSIFLASSLAIPIIFGRFFFKLFVPYHVHDGYSFIAGFYLLWGCWLLNMVVERMDKHRQRRGGGEPRADLPLYFAKRSLLWLAKASYMTFFLGFVIPTLIAVVVELYVVMPFRQTFYPDMPPRIRIVDMWALGLLYTKIALQGPRVRPVGRITIGLERIRTNGWTSLRPLHATKEVIAPLTAGLLAMILLPAGVLWLVQRLVHLRVDQHFLCVIKSWSQTVRDKEFLVEMRLQNLDPEPEREQDRRGELWEVETVKDENEDD